MIIHVQFGLLKSNLDFLRKTIFFFFQYDIFLKICRLFIFSLFAHKYTLHILSVIHFCRTKLVFLLLALDISSFELNIEINVPK